MNQKTREQAERDILLECVKNWMKFEDDSIAKLGSYEGARINELVSSAREALKQIGEME